MMLALLFGLLAAGVACAYIPWDERIVRMTNLAVGVGASIVAGFLAHAAATGADASGTTVMGIVLTIPAYLAALALANHIVTRDHLEGPLSLMSFRCHFAGLHVVVATMFALALFDRPAVVIGGAVVFVGLCVATYRCRNNHNSRTASILRDGAFVAVLSMSLLRMQMLASAQVQTGSTIACLVVGLLGMALSVALAWKRAALLNEAAVFFAIAMSVLALGLGPAGIIATAMLWFALLVTALLVHVGALIDWARPIVRYLSLGLPPSALAIPYFITFGYGLQLRPWVTAVALVAYAALVVRAIRLGAPETGKWVALRVHRQLAVAIVLNVAVAIALSTPYVMLFIIDGVTEITSLAF